MKNSRVLTILFTDIAGFTEKTSRSSREEFHRYMDMHDHMLKPIFSNFKGNIIKTIGDAFLVTFESPTNAVVCAVFIQEKLKKYNSTVEEDAKIKIRIAINSGEVEERNGDVFGDPVNIAARIESITDPGEIYFTESVYLSMNKSEVPTCEVGLKILKGIPEPVKVYKVTFESSEGVERLKKSYPQSETNFEVPEIESNGASSVKVKKKRSKLFYATSLFVSFIVLLIVLRFLTNERDFIGTIESNLRAKNNSHHIILAYFDRFGKEEKVIEWENKELVNDIYRSISDESNTDPLEAKKELEIKYKRYYWNLKDYEVLDKLSDLFVGKEESKMRMDLLKKAYHLSENNEIIEQKIYSLIVEYPEFLTDFISGRVLYNYYLRNKKTVKSDHAKELIKFIIYNENDINQLDETISLLKKIIKKEDKYNLLFDENVKVRLFVFELCEKELNAGKLLEFYSYNLFNLGNNDADMLSRSYSYVSSLKGSPEWNVFKTSEFYNRIIRVVDLPAYGKRSIKILTLFTEMFSPEIIDLAKKEFETNNDYYDRINIFDLLIISNSINDEQKWNFHRFSLLKTTMKYSEPEVLSRALSFYTNVPKEKKENAIAVLEEGLKSIQEKRDQYLKENRTNWVTNAEWNIKKVEDAIKFLNLE